mmetsp:Transcript_14703/g.44138  ORF Transcript_14703/g.44138 Transcript_14703/m.44138 type:complete len:239 (-) Transcript_14703:5645-6361(-)
MCLQRVAALRAGRGSRRSAAGSSRAVDSTGAAGRVARLTPPAVALLPAAARAAAPRRHASAAGGARPGGGRERLRPRRARLHAAARSPPSARPPAPRSARAGARTLDQRASQPGLRADRAAAPSPRRAAVARAAALAALGVALLAAEAVGALARPRSRATGAASVLGRARTLRGSPGSAARGSARLQPQRGGHGCSCGQRERRRGAGLRARQQRAGALRRRPAPPPRRVRCQSFGGPH